MEYGLPKSDVVMINERNPLLNFLTGPPSAYQSLCFPPVILSTSPRHQRLFHHLANHGQIDLTDDIGDKKLPHFNIQTRSRYYLNRLIEYYTLQVATLSLGLVKGGGECP